MGIIGAITDSATGAINNAVRRLGFGGDFGFLSDPAHTRKIFSNQDAALEINTPRFGFQFLVVFNMARSATATEFAATYFPQSEDMEKVNELVKSVEMPSMSIDTEILNQYNKKRISQKKINFNPITLTMHDVADGKTLRFWEMYYEFYFKDGVNSIQRSGTKPAEPNPPVMADMPSPDIDVILEFAKAKDREGYKQYMFGVADEYKAVRDQNIAKMARYNEEVEAAREKNLARDIYTNMKRFPSSGKLYSREFRDDIVQDRFNGSYGYNLERVGDDRYLIDSMDIYQFHGGKFSKVTLIHPRISAFNHTQLGHDENDLVEISYTFEYEDAVYRNRSDEIAAEVLKYLVDEHFLEVDKLAPNDFSILGAFKDATGIEIGENSVLGNAISSAATGAGIVGDQYIKAASSSVFGGGNVPYPDPSAALKQISRNGTTNAAGSLGTSFTSGVKDVTSSFLPNLKG